MGGAGLILRRLESRRDLPPAEVLAHEYGEWALSRAETQYGVIPDDEGVNAAQWKHSAGYVNGSRRS
jgi:hypothetical protein